MTITNPRDPQWKCAAPATRIRSGPCEAGRPPSDRPHRRDKLLDHRGVGDKLLDHRGVGEKLLDHGRGGEKLLDHRGFRGRPRCRAKAPPEPANAAGCESPWSPGTRARAVPAGLSRSPAHRP